MTVLMTLRMAFLAKSPLKIRPLLPIFAGILLASVLSACATKDAHWVHKNLDLTENFHAGTKVLETPKIPDTGAHQVKLRATARTRGKRIGADIELVVRAEFDDFSFLDRASFASGRAFPLTVIKRETEDCGTSDRSLCDVHEHVSLKLSRNYLMSKRASGFNVKLWGRRDSVVLFVPPDFIEGLLARMENRAPLNADEISAATQGPVPASPAPSSSRRH
jgi:hypothetical protein